MKCCEWHPYKSLIASCGKDATVRLWDPRTHQSVNTLYAHKSQIFKVREPVGYGDVRHSGPGLGTRMPGHENGVPVCHVLICTARSRWPSTRTAGGW